MRPLTTTRSAACCCAGSAATTARFKSVSAHARRSLGIGTFRAGMEGRSRSFWPGDAYRASAVFIPHGGGERARDRGGARGGRERGSLASRGIRAIASPASTGGHHLTRMDRRTARRGSRASRPGRARSTCRSCRRANTLWRITARARWRGRTAPGPAASFSRRRRPARRRIARQCRADPVPFELLTPTEVRARWPQIAPSEQDRWASWIRVRACSSPSGSCGPRSPGRVRSARTCGSTSR